MFITLEGTEGAGKSTLINALKAKLTERGLTVCVTREPGGTPLAEQIRALLLSTGDEAPVPDCELLLLFAARVQHWQRVIAPALAAGQWVLSDRYTDATYAYQCGGRGLKREPVDLLKGQFAPRNPDLTLWLDVPVEVGMQRAGKRGTLDRFEQEDIAFFERVRSVYEELYRCESQRFYRLDAHLSAQAVLEQALKILAAYLPC